MMTLEQAVDKVMEMRAAGPDTVMMHLFGIISADVVAEHKAESIAAAFAERTGKRIGKGEPFQDARNLAAYVTVRTDVWARWRP